MTTVKSPRIKRIQQSRKSTEKVLGRTSALTVRFGKKNTANEVTKKTVAKAAKKAGLSMNRFLHVAVARYILIRQITDPDLGTFSKKKLAHIRIVANPLSKKTGKPIFPPL